MKTAKRKEYGQYIVSDPEICGGQLTFQGTRIFVKDVLEMVAQGWAWDKISEAWFGRIGAEAIAEAIGLANTALSQQTGKQRRAA